MTELLSDSWQVARKNHCCGGWEQLTRNGTLNELAEDGKVSKAEVEYLENNHPHIPKGSKYYKQGIKGEDGMYTWKTCKKCLDIIRKFKLWDEYE